MNKKNLNNISSRIKKSINVKICVYRYLNLNLISLEIRCTMEHVRNTFSKIKNFGICDRNLSYIALQAQEYLTSKWRININAIRVGNMMGSYKLV